VTISAETHPNFRTLSGWTLDRPAQYSDAMNRKNSNMRQTVENIVRAVATAGPVGWIALVACAAMALAAYAISAILTIVHTLR
jgi:hypothetical protein